MSKLLSITCTRRDTRRQSFSQHITAGRPIQAKPARFLYRSFFETVRPRAKITTDSM